MIARETSALISNSVYCSIAETCLQGYLQHVAIHAYLCMNAVRFRYRRYSLSIMHNRTRREGEERFSMYVSQGKIRGYGRGMP